MSFDQRPAQAKVRIPASATLPAAPTLAVEREADPARAPKWLFLCAALIGGAATSAALTVGDVDVANLVGVAPIQQQAVQQSAQQAAETPFDPR